MRCRQASTVTPADGGLRLMTADDGGAVEFSVLVFARIQDLTGHGKNTGYYRKYRMCYEDCEIPNSDLL